jgi:HEAT repeat protein
VNVKKSRFVAWTGLPLPLALALVCIAGCGRQRQPNVPPGEERVFRKTPVSAEAGPGTPTRVDETLSEEELRRRNLVRQIADQFKNAKSSDDRLEALGSLDKVLPSLKGRAPELVPYVARCLTDPDPDQKIYGIRARAAISPKDALPDIKLVLRDADPKVRQAAVEAFLMLPDPLPFDALFAHLESERDPYVQQAVMVVIATRGDETQLTRVLGHVKDLEVKAVAPVVDLARKYPAVARPRADALAYFLDRNDADLRMQVAKLLGEWGIRTQPVLSGLVRALNDNELSVRRAAIQALKTISDNQDLGYNPEADAKARQEAVAKWKAWVKEAGDGGESAPTSAPTSR